MLPITLSVRKYVYLCSGHFISSNSLRFMPSSCFNRSIIAFFSGSVTPSPQSPAVSALVRNMVEVFPGQLLPRHGRGSAKSRAAIYELALEACQGDVTEVLERFRFRSTWRNV